ncbi:MAG: CoA-binding protein [Treponemataceae bacterium]|jgi:predicted CoA-binding protein
MGKRIARSFFEAPEVLFVGYSRKHESFCKAVYEAFEKHGTKVYPVNPKPASFSIPVFASVDAVPARPEFAYVLTPKGITATLVDKLVAQGVKRVLFQSKMSVDTVTLQRCAELGIQTAVACPMMAMGGGFHKFHGFLAGVRG